MFSYVAHGDLERLRANHFPDENSSPGLNIFMTGTDTASAIDDALISVWRQALVENKKIITVGNSTFSVRRTAKHQLAQVDFQVDGVEFRGLEQNPQTKSRWAKMAREGAKVMQFLRAGRYVGVVADGALKHYSSAEKA